MSLRWSFAQRGLLWPCFAKSESTHFQRSATVCSNMADFDAMTSADLILFKILTFFGPPYESNLTLQDFSFRQLLATNSSSFQRIGSYLMAKKVSKRREWTPAQVRTLKSLARQKKHAANIAKALKRTEGATRQKAFSLGVSLDSRA
jgi:hypothetical protein